MKKWVALSGMLTLLIFLEDAGFFILGRCTEIGLGFGGTARIRRVKKFLGE
mgnify:CR=1 FL=1|jgi:hypothetical protein